VNIQVWTDTDLHGAGATLLLKWLYKDVKAFNVQDVSESTLTGRFKGALHTLDHYDRVYIVDLDLTADQIQLVDRANVVVIDSHNNHATNKDLYKKAKVIIDSDVYSCTSLIYEKFKSHLSHLTKPQLDLIECIKSYDWYNAENKESLKLNAIYYNLNSPKTENFINAFESGIREYTVQEKNAVKLYFKKFKEQLSNEAFKGKIKDYNIIATFANYAINELAHYLIKKHNADISIIVNPQSKTVSFRRAKLCQANVSLLAQKLCGGGGHAAAAGGKLTNEFATLTKQFTPC
jgi:nanoRNase/pAp phosphatase (c-di-AMP/oligoRNAs hydrolase)|tara:strand:+ start:4911 stop:5783 length:873 start_codon:yes stop_codon:yes gene_type:complete